MTLYDGWLYFSEVVSGVNYISRMRPDGSEHTRLVQVYCWYMTLIGDTIYYVNYDNAHSLDAVSTDGTGHRTVISAPTSDLCAVSGVLYFSTDRSTRYLHYLVSDGSSVQLSSSYHKHTTFAGDSLYSTNAENRLVRMDLSGNVTRIYDELGYISYPVIVGNYLYYSDSDGSRRLAVLPD